MQGNSTSAKILSTILSLDRINQGHFGMQLQRQSHQLWKHPLTSSHSTLPPGDQIFWVRCASGNVFVLFINTRWSGGFGPLSSSRRRARRRSGLHKVVMRGLRAQIGGLQKISLPTYLPTHPHKGCEQPFGCLIDQIWKNLRKAKAPKTKEICFQR